MTKLTVSLTATTQAVLLAQIGQAVRLGAEAVEVRLDYLTESVDCDQIVQACSMPIVWTNRHRSEGGRFQGSEDERIEQLLAAVQAGGDYIDIEYRQWAASDQTRQRMRLGKRQAKLILSFHDFSGVPDDLERIVDELAGEAEVVKFAVTAGDVFDNFRVFNIIRKCTKPVIGLAMGQAGQMSRILAKKFGCEITFASLGDDKASAPGQLTVGELKDTNWDRIGRDTKVLGVVGHPVEHSLSPAMHNAAYSAMGFEGVYVRFDVPTGYETFERFVDLVRSSDWLRVIGLSVTIPHKANAIKYLEDHGGRVDPLAKRIGAVNTLRFEPDGGVSGYNTDYLGVLAALREVVTLEGKRVAVLGAGGVARAIVAATVQAGGQVVIYNRTAAKAAGLAEEFACACRAWAARDRLDADVVINATSIGMWPAVDESPLAPAWLRPGMVVFDTVYNPLRTKLLESATSAGAVAVDGAGMLLYQAVEQIRLWADGSESAVPVNVMRKALLAGLGAS